MTSANDDPVTQYLAALAAGDRAQAACLTLAARGDSIPVGSPEWVAHRAAQHEAERRWDDALSALLLARDAVFLRQEAV